jgi:uncharacterized protein
MVSKDPILVTLLMLGFITFFGLGRASAEEINKGLATMTQQIGSKTLTLEIATTPEQQQIGLMNRKSMPPDKGMIFVFNPPRQVHFWMKNTYIPLSAAFVAEDGTVVKIADMDPLSEKHHSTDAPVKFVIEVNQGVLKDAGLRVGDALKINWHPKTK